MRFCVTGATGFLGNNLCRLLVDQGHEVVAPVRNSSLTRPLQGLPVEIARGDLESADFVEQIVGDTEGVFHSAAVIWLGRSRRAESIRVNVDITHLIGQACARHGVRMVHVSTTDALAAGSPARPATENDIEPAKGDSNYVVSKRLAERCLLEMHARHRLDVVIVNPGLLLGPFDWKPSTGKMILAVTDGFVPMAPSGGISVADVRQVCKAIVVAFFRGEAGQRYILAGENLSYLELWRRMAQRAGRRGPWTKLGGPYAKVVGWIGDAFGKVFGEGELNSRSLQLGTRFNFYDSSRAIRELAYDPGSLDEALDAQWQWLRENGYTRHSLQNGNS